MSTQKWSDDDLDDLFRKSAEESDPAYDPAAWQNLQGRLNNRDRALLTAKVLRWVLPALLLLVSTGGLVWYARLHTTGEPAIAVMRSANAVTKTQGTLPPAEGTTPTELAASTKRQPEATQLINKATNRNTDRLKPAEVGQSERMTTTSNVLVVNNGKAGSAVSVTKPRGIRQSVSPGQIGEPINSDQLRSKSVGGAAARQPSRVRPSASKTTFSFVAGRPTSYATDKARPNAKIGGLGRQRSAVSGLIIDQYTAEKAKSGQLPNVGLTSQPATQPVMNGEDDLTTRLNWPTLEPQEAKRAHWPAPPSFALTEPVLPDAATATPSLSRSSQSYQTGLSLQLLISPDLSSIGLHNFDRPGSNVGLMAQYRLSRRFSIQAGALWSTKIYKTSASEYKWPVPTGVGVTPESISGKCTMLDIPLNLRYDVLLRPSESGNGPTRWFISGGVTSYFIDHEKYDFTYANPYDPAIKYRGWDNKVVGRKGGSFGLSNINVSIGYERPVTRRLSWQIEPFIKIPTQEIGYFKVRLLSTGGFLSLRYHL